MPTRLNHVSRPFLSQNSYQIGSELIPKFVRRRAVSADSLVMKLSRDSRYVADHAMDDDGDVDDVEFRTWNMAQISQEGRTPSPSMEHACYIWNSFVSSRARSSV